MLLHFQMSLIEETTKCLLRTSLKSTHCIRMCFTVSGHQGRRQELMEGVYLLSFRLPFPFIPSPPLSYPFPSLPLPSPPLRSRAPLSQLGGLGSAVSSPSGVQGGAPAANAFFSILGAQKRIWWQQFHIFVMQCN